MFNSFNSSSHDPELIRTVLEPLLEDFQYWFERSRSLLESQDIRFLGPERQSELLEQVKQAQKGINVTRMLVKATDGQVGVETSVLMPWHQLVTECWQVAARHRLEQTVD